MNDLLLSVKGAEAPTRPGGPGGDVEAPAAAQEVPQDKHMEEFFQEVTAIKVQLNSIRESQTKLVEMHERSKTITRSADMKELREKMQVDIDGVNKIAHQCKNRIDRLMKMNEAALNRKGCGPGSSSERTRTAITAALSKKLKDLMGDFQNLRARLQQEYRDTVQRRVVTVTGNKATEEEIDQMIDSGESETIFQKAIMEQGRGHVLDTLAEVQERHEAVKELEKSLMELHQVFLDMAVLVEAQGEMLDNIEQQVSKARDHVESGVGELIKAKKLQKSTRKWMCCALVVLLIIIAVIVVVAIRPWRVRMSIRVTSDVLELGELSAFVQDPEAGAVATFSGTTRDSFLGKKVVRLEYEAYAPMAEAKLKELCQTAMKRWQVKRTAVAHRTGVCPIGEASVIIAMSSAHRKDALEACAWAIDELKATVPIWKREVYEDGSVWKENAESTERLTPGRKV
eukprot:jgi/Astpho2/1953/Aster-00466